MRCANGSSKMMTNIPLTIQALQEAGLRDKVKIMIGGAPITAEFAQQVGADGYAADANKAVSVAKELLGIAKSFLPAKN